ncbi:MAG: Gfo/Idh/MocA family protein [Bacteroidota bacterium]
MQNVAIVGFGFMGMTHAAAILKQKELRLVAIVDKGLDGITQKLSTKTGNFTIEGIDPGVLAAVNKYSDIGECVHNEQIDAVHICVHTDLHYSMARELLDAGYHVFLEKPMTLNIEEGQELVDLAHKHQQVFMVGHVVRFMPPYQRLKKWVEEKTYGPLRFLSLSRFSGVPMWGQWKEKQSAFGSSGGALFDFLIHDIDFANYLLGNPDKIESHTRPGHLSNYDYVCAFWDYTERNIRVKVEGGNIFHSTFPFQAGFAAEFENASVFYSTLKPESIQVATHDELTHIEDIDQDGFANEIEYFYQCINESKPPTECLPESSLETIKLCYQHINESKK